MRLIKGELYNMNAKLDNMSNYSKSLGELDQAISSFVSNTSEKLSGPGYDAVRSSIDVYKSDVKRINNHIESIHANGVKANNNMGVYMTPKYYVIDDSDKGEIERKLVIIRKRIANIYNNMGSLDEETRYKFVSELANLQESYDKLYNKYTIIAGLKSKDDSEYSLISSIPKNLKYSPHSSVFSYTRLFRDYDLDLINWEGTKALSKLFAYYNSIGLSKDRINLIMNALKYLGTGVRYATNGNNKYQYINGHYYLECAGFVYMVYKDTFGNDFSTYDETDYSRIDGGSGCPAYNNAHTFASTQCNGLIRGYSENDELLPGDIYANNSHVMLYLGENEEGKKVFIHCTDSQKDYDEETQKKYGGIFLFEGLPANMSIKKCTLFDEDNKPTNHEEEEEVTVEI